MIDELVKKKSCWLDVKALARVEATSEDSRSRRPLVRTDVRAED